MVTWNNLDTLESFKELSKVGRVDIKEAMSGDNGAKRVKEYNIPMAEGFTYNFAAKQVDADVLEALANLAKEAQLTEKFEALYRRDYKRSRREVYNSCSDRNRRKRFRTSCYVLST